MPAASKSAGLCLSFLLVATGPDASEIDHAFHLPILRKQQLIEIRLKKVMLGWKIYCSGEMIDELKRLAGSK
jgi:hypothetical protein